MLCFTVVTEPDPERLENKVNEHLRSLRGKRIVDKQITSHYCNSGTYPHSQYTVAIWYIEGAEPPSDPPAGGHAPGYG